jgi:hypothetical protein
MRDCTGRGLYFGGHSGFRSKMRYSSLDEYGGAIKSEADSKEINVSKSISLIA